MTRWKTAATAGLVAICAVALVTSSSGCKKPKRRILTKAQKRLVSESVLEAPPELASPLNADLEGKIKLLGVEVSPNPIAAGGDVTITYYWKCLEALPGGWTVFGHLEQGSVRQLLDHQPVDALYPIRDWQPGQIIRDVQRIEADDRLKLGKAMLWVGIFDEEAWKTRQESRRLALSNPDAVPNDGQNRVKAMEIEVSKISKSAKKKKGKTKKGRPPRYFARPVQGEIVLDGKLDDETWRRASKSRVFLRPDGRPASRKILTRAQLAYDDTTLYVAFDVKDPDVSSTFANRDDTLWEQDVVEVYLDPGSDGKDYLELQVSPNNVVFDAIFTSRRKPKWQEASKRNLKVQSAVSVDGTANASDDEDVKWTVEIAIPFAELPGVDGKPGSGDTWTLNMYRIDNSGPRNMAYQAAWAPVGGDFHDLSTAGELRFVEASNRALPKTKPAASPTLKPLQTPKPPTPATPVAQPSKPSQPAGEPAPSAPKEPGQ